jgi:hypothetical protein
VYSSSLPKGRPSSNRLHKQNQNVLSKQKLPGNTDNLAHHLNDSAENVDLSNSINGMGTIGEQPTANQIDINNWINPTSMDWNGDIDNAILSSEQWLFEPHNVSHHSECLRYLTTARIY